MQFLPVIATAYLLASDTRHEYQFVLSYSVHLDVGLIASKTLLLDLLP